MPDPMNPQPTRTELDEQALERWVQLNSGNASQADWQAFQQWRQRSAAHAAAADEVEQLWHTLGHTQPPNLSAQVAPAPGRTRRVRRWAALAACVAALAVVGLHGPARVLTADQATATGERRTLTLDDGSQVWLNSASAVNIDYSAQRREITLLKGEALFQVSKDAARPFVVVAGDGEVRAVGTRFDVDLHRDRVQVGVAEGVVQVSSGGSRVRLEQSQQVSYQQGRAPSSVDLYDPSSGAAWQRGKLIFNRTTLAEVFEVTERYLPGALVVSGRLPNNPVSGVFDLDDLPAMLDVLSRTQPVKIVRLPWLTVVLFDEKNKSES
ncbi:FecR family protein [Pseudomonas cremoricolorata]|nr:FecR domain-containing protein [Pseudomonas cremoricolorata]